jgi:glycosyltransferase involved in cell wall biosynthesis
MNAARSTASRKGGARLRRAKSVVLEKPDSTESLPTAHPLDWPRCCAVIIPCLNEAAHVAEVVRAARRRLPHVIVVDDGSTDATARVAAEAGAGVLRHATRRGKGAALETGFRHALKRGFAWVLTLDGDGQHDAADIESFLRAAEMTGAPLIVGNRMPGAAAMPWVRRRVNRAMSWCISRRARVGLPDTQCGFRLMRLAEWSALALDARHFVYESELLLAWCRAGQRVGFVPVRVIYEGAASRIAPVRDTARWLRWLAADLAPRRALANGRGRT